MSQIPSITSDYYSASDAGDIARLVEVAAYRRCAVSGRVHPRL